MWLQLFFSFTEQMNNKLKKKVVVVVLLFFLLRCQKLKFSKEQQ